MTEPEPIFVRVEFDDSEAMALAQLCKRIGISELMALSVNEAEAYLMARAMHELRKALGREGFAPR